MFKHANQSEGRNLWYGTEETWFSKSWLEAWRKKQTPATNEERTHKSAWVNQKVHSWLVSYRISLCSNMQIVFQSRAWGVKAKANLCRKWGRQREERVSKSKSSSIARMVSDSFVETWKLRLKDSYRKDQEGGDCWRLESFGSFRISGFSSVLTNNRLWSEEAHAHVHHPSGCMYKGFPNRGTRHGPVNRAHRYAHTHIHTRLRPAPLHRLPRIHMHKDPKLPKKHTYTYIHDAGST